MYANFIKTLDSRLKGSKLLPYVEVHDVDEYFALDKTKRERWGFYRKPFALPCEWLENRKNTGKKKTNTVKGWDAWEKEIKSRYPIQWFFREWMFSIDNPVYLVAKNIFSTYVEIRYNIKRFIYPFYPRMRKVIPRHTYSDPCELFRKINFALVLDFWYLDMVNGVVDWNSDEVHKNFFKSVKNAVKYIETDRIKLETQLDKLLVQANKKYKGNYNQRYAKFHALEQKIKEKDTEILVWIMREREKFWS